MAEVPHHPEPDTDVAHTHPAPAVNGEAIPRPPAPPPQSALPAGAWGQVRSALSVQEIIQRAQSLSRRGKLPGFAGWHKGRPTTTLFTFAAFGEPFDHVVSANATPDGGATTVIFVGKVHWRLPLILLVVLAVSVWPGLPITDSLLRSYFTGYDFATWMWYLPLTVLPLPFMLARMWRKSAAAAKSHALESIEAIRAALSEGSPA